MGGRHVYREALVRLPTGYWGPKNNCHCRCCRTAVPFGGQITGNEAVFAFRQKSLFIPGCVQGAIIRAKRVSNCYMQEKKTDRLYVCLSGCSANLGFSLEKLSWF